jgi:hypothetical protein
MPFSFVVYSKHRLVLMPFLTAKIGKLPRESAFSAGIVAQ